MPDSAEEAVQRPEGHARRDYCTLALLLQQVPGEPAEQWPLA